MNRTHRSCNDKFKENIGVYLILGKEGNPCIGFLVVIMASSIARACARTMTTRVAQDAGHTPANRLTVTFSLDIASFFDTGHHVMVN